MRGLRSPSTFARTLPSSAPSSGSLYIFNIWYLGPTRSTPTDEPVLRTGVHLTHPIFFPKGVHFPPIMLNADYYRFGKVVTALLWFQQLWR